VLAITFELRSAGDQADTSVRYVAASDSGSSSEGSTNSGTPTQAFIDLHPGDYGTTPTITVMADPNDQVSETEESNNTMYIVVDLTAGRGAVSCQLV
jgi:hypothetical protein